MNLLPYELAKELKDAGWEPPAVSSRTRIESRCNLERWAFESDVFGAKMEWVPTLSELIAACPALIELEDHIPNKTAFNLYADIQGDGWWAEYPSLREDNFSALEKTPLEAVAKLWIALKKNGII